MVMRLLFAPIRFMKPTTTGLYRITRCINIISSKPLRLVCGAYIAIEITIVPKKLSRSMDVCSRLRQKRCNTTIPLITKIFSKLLNILRIFYLRRNMPMSEYKLPCTYIYIQNMRSLCRVIAFATHYR